MSEPAPVSPSVNVPNWIGFLQQCTRSVNKELYAPRTLPALIGAAFAPVDLVAGVPAETVRLAVVVLGAAHAG